VSMLLSLTRIHRARRIRGPEVAWLPHADGHLYHGRRSRCRDHRDDVGAVLVARRSSQAPADNPQIDSIRHESAHGVKSASVDFSDRRVAPLPLGSLVTGIAEPPVVVQLRELPREQPFIALDRVTGRARLIDVLERVELTGGKLLACRSTSGDARSVRAESPTGRHAPRRSASARPAGDMAGRPPVTLGWSGICS